MATKREYLDKRLTAVEALKSLVNEAEKANKPVDEQKFNEISAEIDTYGKAIDQLNKLETYESNLVRVYNQPVAPVVVAGTPKEKEAFFNFIRTGQRPETFGLTAGTSGVQVPTPVSTALYEALASLSVVRQNAEVIQTTSTISIGVNGAATAYWTAEGAPYTASAAGGTATLGAYKAAGLVKVTEELLNDSAFALEPYIVNMAANALYEKEESGYLVGTGTTMPNGIFALSTYGGTAIASGSTASGSALYYDDIVNAFYAMPSNYRKNASWVFDSTTVKALRKVKDTTGAPIWLPATRADDSDTLMGRPLLISDALNDFAATTVIGGLVDFSQVVVRDAGPIEVQRLNELFAANGEIGFRFFHRTDIGLKNSKAVYKIVTGS